MARIIDGIKELLGKGKDDDDDVPEYRNGRYDQPGSRYGYPADGAADGRSGSYRSRRPFGEALDDNYIRNGYDTRPSPRGGPEYRKPYGTEYAPPRGAEYASPRGTEYAPNRVPPYASPRGNEYAPNLAAGYVSPRGAEYAPPRGTEYASSNRAAGYVSPRGAEYARGAEYPSTRGAEYPSTRGVEYQSPRGTEYRRPYVGSEVESPRGEYVRTLAESPRDSGYLRGSSRRDASSGETVIEFMVPMCCDKCKEKVREELSDVEGVESVRCDPPNSRVIVTGDDSIDVERCRKKAERAVKKKCEIISTDARDSARYSANRESYPESTNRVPVSPSGRPTLARQSSFASGKVTQYDGVGPRGRDYDANDYNGRGFRRMPSFGAHRNNEAEYITSYDRRPQFQTQVSFSKLPVENPNYVKRVAH